MEIQLKWSVLLEVGLYGGGRVGKTFYRGGDFGALLDFNEDKAPGPGGFSMAFW